MPGRLAALPGHGGAAGRFLHQEGRPLRRRRRRGGRLQPAPRLDSLDAGRALPLHARRRVAAARGARASWRARTGSSTKPRAPPTATNWSAACCPPAASRTSATGGRGSRPVATPGAGSTPPRGRWNRSSIRKPRACARRPTPTTRICWRTSARPPTARRWCACATAPPCRTSLPWSTGAGATSAGFARRSKARCTCSSRGALDPRSPEADWILKDYEDNRYLSNQYGYMLDDFDKHWFGRGGMSMQACLLLDVEPYLYRDDVKHALRALFNAQAVSYFPDVRMNTEHALPAHGRLARRPLQELRRSQRRRLAALPVRARGRRHAARRPGRPARMAAPRPDAAASSAPATYFGPASVLLHRRRE